MIDSRQRFEQAVYHLAHYHSVFDRFLQTLTSIQSKLDRSELDMIRLAIQSEILILSVCVEDEFNHLFCYANNSDLQSNSGVMLVKDLKKLIYKSIDIEWPDIRKFRNHVLAHSMRDDNSGLDSVLINGKISSYRIPDRIDELITFVNYLINVTRKLREVFHTVYEQQKQKFDANLLAETLAEDPEGEMRELYKRYKLTMTEAQGLIDKYIGTPNANHSEF